MSNKRTIAETIEFVENSFPSIWTREDVLTILKEIEDMNGISEGTIHDIAHDIKEEVYSTIDNLDFSDAVDNKSCSFDIENDNEIVITNLEVDSSSVADEVTNDLNSKIIKIINSYIS